METVLKDGRGTGNTAGITDEGRIETAATITTNIAHIAEKHANAFIVSTGFVSLTTTGTAQGLLYFKNNDTTGKSFRVDHIRVCSDSATGSTKAILWKNPTTGTLISDANDAFCVNTTLSSSIAFNGVAYSPSADGKTVTNGTHLTQFITKTPGHSIQEYEGSIIVGRDNAIAITVEIASAGDVCIEVLGHLE